MAVGSARVVGAAVGSTGRVDTGEVIDDGSGEADGASETGAVVIDSDSLPFRVIVGEGGPLETVDLAIR